MDVAESKAHLKFEDIILIIILVTHPFSNIGNLRD